EHLPEGVVDLVRARVRQVLALEPQVVAELRRQVGRVRDGRGSPDEVAKEIGQLAAEPGVVAELEPGRVELVQGGDQDLRRIAPAVGAEATVLVGSGRDAHAIPSSSRLCPRAASPGPRIKPAIAAAASADRISASPTRIADAPAATAAATSTWLPMPLSRAATRSAGLEPSPSSAAGESTRRSGTSASPRRSRRAPSRRGAPRGASAPAVGSERRRRAPRAGAVARPARGGSSRPDR